MKILLINPPLFNKNLRWDEQSATYPPLGLMYIAAVLEQKNHNVVIFDGQAQNIFEEELENYIKNENPLVVGITTITLMHKQILKCIDIIKEANKNIKIILGGPHASLLKTKLMEMNSKIDFIVKGESENTIIELIFEMENEGKYAEISGIIFRKEGKIIENKDRPLLDELDNLPFPARHLLDITNSVYKSSFRYMRLPMTTMITTRGCPYACLFCEHVFGRKYRGHSAEYIINEIEHLQKEYGIKEIQFVDDTFLLDPQKIKTFCNMILEKGIDLTWSCHGRIDVIYQNMELINLIKKAGCWYISFGIESGNKDILTFLRKGINFKQVNEVINQVNKSGIFTKGYFMIGNPTETKETINDTINFAKSLKLDGVQFSLVMPLSNTEFYNICAQYGTFDPNAYENMSSHSNEPVYLPHGLTKEYLKTIQKQAYKEFYIRPNYILRQFFKIRDFNMFKRYLIKGLSYLGN